MPFVLGLYRDQPQGGQAATQPDGSNWAFEIVRMLSISEKKADSLCAALAKKKKKKEIDTDPAEHDGS